MLRIKECQDGGGSVLSDEADLGSVSGVQSPTVARVSQSAMDTPRDSDTSSRDNGHVSRTEAKMTYLLHMLLEAECLDWAGCLALVLQDVMALIRIINTARSSPEDTGARLYHGLKKLGDSYPQYNQFMTHIRPHLTNIAPSLVSSPTLDTSRDSTCDVSRGKSVSPVSRPELSRSMSDPGSGDKRDMVRERRESERSVGAAPSPGVKNDASALNNSGDKYDNEDDDSGCIIM